MSQNSLRLVHSRAFIDQSDDLAAALMFSVTGLTMHLVVVAIGFGTWYF